MGFGSVGSAMAFDKDGNFASLCVVGSGNSLSVISGKAYWNETALEYYNSSTALFEHRDWVGARRAATNSARAVTDVRTSLPFGDGAANLSGGQDNTFDGYTGCGRVAARLPTMRSSANTGTSPGDGCNPIPTPAAMTSPTPRASIAVPTRRIIR
jgi:hypothetical protein